MALIETLMKTKVVTVAPTASVSDAAARMESNGVGAVLVVEDSGQGEKLLGLFSERDLLRRVVVPGLDPKSTSIASVMTPDPIAVEAGVHVRECAELIRDNGFRHLPVTKNGRPIGILSTRDFHEHVVQGLESFISQDQYREALAEGRDPYDHLGGGYGR